MKSRPRFFKFCIPLITLLIVLSQDAPADNRASGVERMVRQAVPEVTVIHDVTDHASGENPFFEGSTV